MVLRNLSYIAALLCLASPSVADTDCTELGKPRSFQAGRNDVFAPPSDPASRRPELEAHFSPDIPWTDFDDPTFNRWVGASFFGLPSSLCRAILVVHLRPLGAGSRVGNDSLLVGSATSGEGFVTSRLADLPEAGGTWSSNTNGNTVFQLELGDLELASGKTVLEVMELDRALDIVVQDDTEVDFFELRVWSSPWITRYCGRPDNYAPPVDPVFRGVELNGAYPDADWKQPDDTMNNRFFGCTFRNLPDSIFDAELEIQMQPGLFTFSGNDTLNIGLLPGPSFRFRSPIQDLPEAAGSWNSSDNGPTLFQRPVTDLIADNRLDVLVQDDTTIDFVRLRYRTCPPPVPCYGLTCLIGSRDFELDEDAIAVAMPGLVALDFTGADGGCLNTGMVCPAVRDETLELLTTGRFDNETDDVTLSLEYANDGSRNTLSADFPEGLDIFMRVEVWQGDDQKVAAHIAPNHGLAAAIPSGSCITELDFLPFGSDPQTECFQVLLKESTPVDILQGGPSGVVGDRIRICPPLITRESQFRLSEMTLSGSGFDQLLIESATVFVGEEAYGAVGPVRLEAADGTLRVAEIPPSGGGFRLGLGEAQSAFVSLTIDAAEPVGASLDVASFGTFDDEPNHELGRLSMTRTDLGVELATDFSSIESPTQIVQVRQGGQVVAEQVLAAGRAVLSPVWPDGVGRTGFETECYRVRFRDPVAFSFFDAAPDASKTIVTGDEICLLAEEASNARIGAQSSLSVVASGGIAELTVTDAQVGRGCVESGTRLCLNQGRFAVEIDWRSAAGAFGAGQAVRLTEDTGYFWFFNADNVELVVKALDACNPFGSQWVFAGGLTDVEVDMKVTDTWTGDIRLYKNPIGTPFEPLQDTAAFAGCDALGAGSEVSPTGPPATGTPSLSLGGGRFEVRAEWQSTDSQGVGQGVPLTEDTGYFWFFNAANVELVIKVLDACNLSGRFWVFAGGLTDVEVEITVTDTETGETVTYANPQGTPFQPIQDTAAFAGCP